MLTAVFRRLFSQVREREGSLSAMEAFSVEVIHQLNAPTIGRFADFLGISQSNATCKVNNLIRKGYIVKENSDTDRREYHLKPRTSSTAITVSCRAMSTLCSDASARAHARGATFARAGRRVGRADARVRNLVWKCLSSVLKDMTKSQTFSITSWHGL